MIKFYIQVTAFVFIALASCSSPKKRLSDRTLTDTLSIVKPSVVEVINNPFNNDNFQIDLFQKHIFFYGANSVEKWELFIQKDNSFTFVLNGEKTVFEFFKGVKEPAGMRYHSKKILNPIDTIPQKKSISITLVEQSSLEKVSINYLPFSVNVTITDEASATTYSGGGFYVSNPALNDIWVLDSLNNEKVNVSKFPQGLPRLEFHLDGGKVFGFSGCNEFTGTYYTFEDEIVINPLASSIRLCDKITGESSFLDLLNKHGFEYYIYNLHLTLQHRDNTRMVFKKVD